MTLHQINCRQVRSYPDKTRGIRKMNAGYHNNPMKS